MDCIALRNTLQAFFKFGNLIVYLGAGRSFAGHVGQTVCLHPQVSGFFNDGGGIFQA